MFANQEDLRMKKKDSAQKKDVPLAMLDDSYFILKKDAIDTDLK